MGMCEAVRIRFEFLMCPRDSKTKRHKMKLSIRTNPTNPNHHLWNNHGRWFVHYVIHPTPFTKERIRHSLGTNSLEEARTRRDAILLAIARTEGGAA